MTKPLFAKTPDDLLAHAEIAKMSGLDFIKGILDGQFPHPPIAQTLGFELSEVEMGRVVFTSTPGFHCLNPMGAPHGGWYGTLLDSAMGCAVQSTLPQGRAYTTLEYKINIQRVAKEDAPPLRAIGSVVTSGRRTATALGELIDENNRVYAMGSTTCLVFDF